MSAASENCAVLGELLERRRDDVLQRWLARVEEEIGPTELDRSQLKDAIPTYLKGLAQVLREGRPPCDQGELWADVAREHGVVRVEQGFDIRELLREFVLLRRVLFGVVREEEIESESIFEIVTEAIEEAIALSVAAYVEMRDLQARRAEAQHVAFLTHELRSPLNSAMLAVSQLRLDGAFDASYEGLAALLERAHRKLTDLIEAVLTVERGRAGELVPARQMTRLATLIDGALEQVAPAAKSKRIDLTAEVDPDLALMIDPRLTASAIQNLVDNAVKYSDRGVVRVWVDERGDEVRIHVVDSCGGMSDEETKGLFTPFRRGRHRRSSTGQGLGLAITKEAIEAQGGSVHVEPAEAACHFWLSLPRSEGD